MLISKMPHSGQILSNSRYPSGKRQTLTGKKNTSKQEKCLINKSQNMTNDPLNVLQSREELYSKDATGQVTIITFMQLTLVCFLQMQHFEQVITEQTEEMS